MLHGEVIEMPPAKHLHSRCERFFVFLLSAAGAERCGRGRDTALETGGWFRM